MKHARLFMALRRLNRLCRFSLLLLLLLPPGCGPGPTPTPTPLPTATPTPTVTPTPTPLPGTTHLRQADGAEVVYLPAGTLPMGSSADEIAAVLSEAAGTQPSE